MSSAPTNSSENELPRDASYWAEQTAVFSVSHQPTGALVLNVEGLQGQSPLQGFGQMWEKVYRVRLTGVTKSPAEVIKIWKEHFPQFWPAGNRFYAPLTGITPGEVAVLRLAPGGMALSTGVMVLYADEESFTLMTPQGHVFAGWITFSAYEDDECTVVQAQILMRASDPLYELGMRFGGNKSEDKFWIHTLSTLATYLGAKPDVETQITCIDRSIQWSAAGNIWQNAAMRTMLYSLTTPLRWIRRRGGRAV
jgi:hypothetical protein